MKKCNYCAKEISYHEMFCCDECQMKSNRYYEKEEKFSKIFMVINTVCVFGIPIGIIVSSVSHLVGTLIASCSCWLLGIMLIFLPFPIESMINKYKLKKAVRMVRYLGVAVILLGFIILGLQLFVFK